MTRDFDRALARELSQLLRLRRLRAEAARTERERRRTLLAAAQTALDEGEAVVRRLRAERATLAKCVCGPIAQQMPRLASFASARAERLDDTLERAVYAVIDCREALSDAQSAFDAAQAAWLHATARCDAVEKLDTTTRRDAASAAEERAERETEAVPGATPLQGMR